MHYPTIYRYFTRFLLLVISLSVIAGCGGESFPAIISSPTPPDQLAAQPGESASSPALDLTATPIPTETPLPSETLAPTATETATLLPTYTPTATPAPTNIPTETPLPTETPIEPPPPTDEPTPTPDSLSTTIQMQANCRYGPGTAYLYSHGLYPGDRVEVDGRNHTGGWLWIQPENLNRHCWAAASVMDYKEEVRSLPLIQTILPKTTFYWPPENVQAFRNGDQVTVTWDKINMTQDKDRGYLLEVTVCQNGSLIWMAVQTYENSYAFTDERTCSGSSGGKVYTAEKHGYTDPVTIPWP